MEQLSFSFMNDTNANHEEVVLTEEELINEANAIVNASINVFGKEISGLTALHMAARGEFYDTELEGSLLHSNLRRIAWLLNLY